MKHRISATVWGFCLAAVFVAFGTPAKADVGGEILGTVRDPSGASVSGAQVTLRNADTGLSRNTKTDSIGNFEFLAVPIGAHYVVDIEAAGFQRDRKSTRLNSSHTVISYAVFCLKKKKK